MPFQNRSWRLVAPIALLIVAGAVPVAAQETQTEKEAARDVMRKMTALEQSLDVPGLVTVLACDYGVISRGLSARMGVGEAELGRSFFDKIIQVPFRMPTHVYRASGYVQQLLKQIGVDVEIGRAHV